MDASAWRTFKHAETLVDPKSKNILPHRMFARNLNFNSQVNLYDVPRFQRHHTRLIWTRLLGGHSNTRRHFLTQNPKTFNYTGCVHAIKPLINSQVNLHDVPRFQRHHTRLIWTRLLGGHSNTRRHFLTQNPKTFYHIGCLHAIQTLIAR